MTCPSITCLGGGTWPILTWPCKVLPPDLARVSPHPDLAVEEYSHLTWPGGGVRPSQSTTPGVNWQTNWKYNPLPPVVLRTRAVNIADKNSSKWNWNRDYSPVTSRSICYLLWFFSKIKFSKNLSLCTVNFYWTRLCTPPTDCHVSLNQGRSPCFHASSAVVILRFTSDVTPADCVRSASWQCLFDPRIWKWYLHKHWWGFELSRNVSIWKLVVVTNMLPTNSPEIRTFL